MGTFGSVSLVGLNVYFFYIIISAWWIPWGAKIKTVQALSDILEFTIYPVNENHALKLCSFCGEI